MARDKKQSEEPVGGAPEWMVTFSDCMTLLLTFFVLLLSFATFKKETIPTLSQSFAKALPSVGSSSVSKQESIWKKQASQDTTQQPDGTETRTLAEIMKKNFMREKKPLDFKNLKVFSVPSGDFFWGQGTALSKTGIETLDALAVFLKSTTGRVVISENGPGRDPALGLDRAMAVVEYLTKQMDLPPKRFSISGNTTMREPSAGRRLEVTLLERSLYE